MFSSSHDCFPLETRVHIKYFQKLKDICFIINLRKRGYTNPRQNMSKYITEPAEGIILPCVQQLFTDFV